jgi:hypothetical protein
MRYRPGPQAEARREDLMSKRRVRVTIDFVLMYDEPRTGLPPELLPSRRRNTLLDFLVAGCKAVGVKDAEIQPRASCHVRFAQVSRTKSARSRRRG